MPTPKTPVLQTPEAVIFDWNGTLNDMSVLLEQDIAVGRQLGVNLTEADVRACWGQPAEPFFTQLYIDRGVKLPWQQIRQIFNETTGQFPRRLLPGAIPVLSRLRAAGIVTGVVTSGQHETIKRAMAEMALPPGLLDFVHTEEHIGEDMANHRPALTRAVGELALRGIRPGRAVFVGDEPVTIRDALAVGAGFVVVEGGTMLRERLLADDVPEAALISRLEELPARLGLAA